jgi:hypothetical protein
MKFDLHSNLRFSGVFLDFNNSFINVKGNRRKNTEHSGKSE